ncbi:hypothetical protein BH10BDE1_BH10BDE1_35980 [soil metagenome]
MQSGEAKECLDRLHPDFKFGDEHKLKTSEVRKKTARVATWIAVLLFGLPLYAARFEACESTSLKTASPTSPAPVAASLKNGPLIIQSCARDDGIALLRTTGFAVASSLDTTMQNLKDANGLQTELEKTVLNHLGASLAKYSRLAECDSKCATELNPMIMKLTTDVAQLRTEMSLRQPDEVGTIAIETTRGWFSERPKHPFAKSPSVPSVSNEERTSTRDEFLKRLATKLPFVAARMEGVKAHKSVLAETPGERAQVAQAVIQIQNDARKNYLRAIGANPLLIFLDQNHPERPTSTRDLAVASQRLAKEISTEKKRLQEIPPSPEKSQAFLEYRTLAERTLQRHPEYCSLAQSLADSSDRRRDVERVGIVVGQIAVGFASAALCSTLVSCGVVAAVFSGADYGVAAHEASVAFRRGLGATVTAQGSDSSELMTNADSAARIQGLALALGAPTVLSTGGSLLRVSGAFLRRSATSAETATATVAIKSTASTSELTGLSTSRRATPNPFFAAVYTDLFKSHVGREKEVIEELIHRYEAKGLNAVDISMTVKQRVRQCVH